MALDDRLFEPPAADAEKVEARLARLPPALRALIERAGDSLTRADLNATQRTLSSALAMAPAQPDVLRLYALLQAHVGNFAAARSNFDSALRVAPDDAVTFWQYARTCEDAGDVAAAFSLRRRATETLPQSPLAWSDLGEHLFTHAGADVAVDPLEHAVRLAPDFAPAVLKLGNALVACGRAQEGASLIRRAIAIDPGFGAAWNSLVDVKTVTLSESELSQLRELLSDPWRLPPAERSAIEFALAAACEQVGRYDEAWNQVVEANRHRKSELAPWDRKQFVVQEQNVERVFAENHAHASDPTLGAEMLFIVGMPRSGTTLVEHILASHPRVSGSGELAALPQVLTEESAHRQSRYPDWVPEASPIDWQRLGQRYLELTAHHRRTRPYSTDKLPGNWRALGAIRAMLPGARIVICRRDALENCWSCFKQYFPRGWEFTNDLDDLALFWKTFDHAASEWSRRDPASIRSQRYESLVEAPDEQIRALLSFCGLPFDAACLRPHESRRNVNTLSAAQVREPMHRPRSLASRYGVLLDPLRRALDIPVS